MCNILYICIKNNCLCEYYRYNFSLCASTANVSNIKLSQVLIGNMTVENLNSFQVFGAKELNSTIFETTTSINTVDLLKKYFIGVTIVKDILPSYIKGFNLKGNRILSKIY